MAYYELKQFIDNAGHLITAKILVQPAGCDVYFNEKPEYKGVFVATIQTQTQFGPSQKKIEFNFPKDMSIEECFEKYEEIAIAEFENIKKKWEEQVKEQNRIIVPGANNGVIL